MRRRDEIELLETAYNLSGTALEWQQRLTKLVARHWEGGAFSYAYDASEPAALIRERLVSAYVDSEIDVQTVRHMLNTPIPTQWVSPIFVHGPHLQTFGEATGTAGLESPAYERVKEAGVGAYTLAIRTLDPSCRGICFCLRERPVSTRLRERWGLVASHMAIGYRLRRSLMQAGGELDGTPEAVLDLEGRLQHAEGEAGANDARQQLRDAARQVMRARGALRKQDADEALEIWKGLVAGRWSLVDRFDSDGKHFLVAHKNPPEVRDRRALSAREQQVASYLAMGFSNKLIGYSLGISASATADHVASIAKKLRSESRVELVRMLAAVSGGRR